MATQDTATDASFVDEEVIPGGTNANDSVATEKSQKEDRLVDLVQMNEVLSLRPQCISRQNRKAPMKCCCLGVMHGKPEYCHAVAEYQILFESMTFVDQKRVVIEWMRANTNEGQKKLYRIPFVLDNGDDPDKYRPLKNALVCSNALMDLLNKGLRWWNDCGKHYRRNTLPQHKLTGKASNRKRKFLEQYEDDLIDHFEELKREAEPIATRYVREVTGETTLRDAEEDVLASM